MIAPVVHILPFTIIRRERILPVPGKVLIRQGQHVAPKDVIATANIAPEHILINVARGLGVSPQEADGLLQRNNGEDVNEGDLLAGPVGLTRRVVRSSRSGRIVLAGDGQVLLEVEAQPHELRAGMDGTVIQLITERGAIIETTGALIQGVWGNGRMDFGLMQPKITTPKDTLTADQLDVSLRGAVIFGGYCEDPKALRNAADIPLRGMILGSMAASLIPLATKMPFPLIVLEGFGHRPIDSASYSLISAHQNREMSLLAESFDRFKGSRPELIITLPATKEPQLPLETDDFTPAQKVRINQAPYAAMIATIESIEQNPTRLPNGLHAPVAMVTLENNERATIPLANLEVLV